MLVHSLQNTRNQESGKNFFSYFRFGVSSLKSPLARDTLLLAFGQGMVALAMLLGMRVITGLVSQTVYGQISLLVGISLLGRQTLAFPYLQAALRFYPEAHANNQVPMLRKMVSSKLVKIIFPSLLLFLAGGLLFSFLKNNLLLIPFVFAAGLMASETAITLETDLYNAARYHRHFVAVSVINAWLRPALAICGIILISSTTETVLAGYLSASLFVLVMLHVLPIMRIGVENEINASSNIKDFSRNAQRYALPLIPLAIVGWISSLSDRYLIAAFIDVRSVGLYAAAYSLMSLPFTMVQAILERSLRPVYFNSVSNGNTEMANRCFSIWWVTVLAICSAGVLLVCSFSNTIASICLAPSFAESAAFMPWIALGNLFLAVSRVFENRCMAAKRSGYVLGIRTSGAVFSIITVIPFLKHYGVLGAAWAVPVYFGLQLVISIFLSGKLSNRSSQGV